MAKLRIGIMLDPREAAAGPNGKSIDIAFLQDVVSRRAHVEWIDVPASEPVDLLEHVPPRWAYKRSAVEDQLKSTSYLACPRQPRAGWAYLATVYGAVEHKDPQTDRCVLPARQIVFQDANVHQLFREVHELAEWVVNYDDLLDKRQLQNQGITVIRYQRQRNHGRNLIVSSTSPLRTLRVLVKRRLEELDLGLPAERTATLAERMIGDASGVSGDIVLRAAKQGVFAGELVGIVLSRAIAAEELGSVGSTAWFFLDDYAAWLGQREGRIADLMALSAQEIDGRTVLRLLITEAKYVHAESLANERKSSAQQLEDTVARMHSALFGDPGRLDRDLWLSRLSDLLLESVGTLAAEAQTFEDLRSKVRAGEVEIELKGYSHVFVSGPTDEGSSGEQNRIARVDGCLQEVFSREQLRALVKAYEAKRPMRPIRSALGDDRPWETLALRKPAVPRPWVHRLSSSTPAPEPVARTESGTVSRAEVNVTEPTPPGTPLSEAKPGEAARGNGISTTPSTETVAPDPPRAGSTAYGDGLRLLLARVGEMDRSAGDDEEWLASVAYRLRSALLGYQLGATVLGTRLTPNAALIRLQGSDRLSLDMVERRRSELLTTHGLSVISLIAQPGEIVVAVARPQREVVPLWDVLRRREVNTTAGGMNTSFVVGVRELDGEILYLNLAERFAGLQQHAPHTLIAGATGSGKSVLLQNLLLDICATNTPDLAQIHMIDPKMGVDYPAIRRLPHLRGGIITERDDAQHVLSGLLDEMDRRYRQFADKGVRNLARYNAAAGPDECLPAIFLVHDEFAEWMMDDKYKDAVSNTVARLGVKARAAGIHLVFAAQRPDNTVFPMQLRSNLGNRLVLRVEDVGTSEIALQAKGAERLLGNGHLVARLTGEPALIYAQVPFLSDDDFANASAALMEGQVA
jgi:DNA segregation ATPase FtsK/SpoIIIE, S-DNA-T family